MTTKAHVAVIQDPTRREHFVYWAYDANGVLLYIGCTMQPEKRWAGHLADRREWTKYVARFRMQGPYNYDTARLMERLAIDEHEPPFNNDTEAVLTFRRKRRATVDRLIAQYAGEGESFADAVAAAVVETDRILAEPVRYQPVAAS